MPDRVLPGPVDSVNNGNRNCNGRVRIHTSKIFDACREQQ